MLKKKLALALSLAGVVAMTAGCAGNKTDGNASATADTIKIGAIAPLTGGVATFGQSTKKAIELLQEQVNDEGGINGKKVEFVIVDDASTPSTAATVAQRLISDDKVVAIVGPLTSGCAGTVGPICQRFKVPMLTGTATNKSVTDAGDYVFRSCFIDPYQSEVMAKVALNDVKAKKAAVLYNKGDDYSNGLTIAFKDDFKAGGGSIVAEETYETDAKDFNTQLSKIKSASPDVIFLPDYYNTVALIMKNARQMGIKSTFLGVDGWDSTDLFKLGEDAVNDSYYSDHYTPADTSTESVKKFTAAYNAKYKANPDALAAMGYEAALVMVNAIKNAGSTENVMIKDALKNYNGPGLASDIKFDSTRTAIKPIVIVKIENQKNVLFKKITPSTIASSSSAAASSSK